MFKFQRKTLVLESVQIEIFNHIRKNLVEIYYKAVENRDRLEEDLDQDTLDNLDRIVISNILEFKLNIDTIIVNFQRITGVKLRANDDGSYSKRQRFVDKGQIFFLLDRNTSRVYGKKLIYLKEELKNEMRDLENQLDKLFTDPQDEASINSKIQYINDEYFKINADMNILIDEINNAIDSLYDNISSNRNKNISLSFLLISAFLSIILFFPEFNTMLNLRDKELTFEEQIDNIIYDKLYDEISLEELLEIRNTSGDLPMDQLIEDEAIRQLIQTSIDRENQSLRQEKNRINLFIKILMIILVPFVIWTIFIAL